MASAKNNFALNFMLTYRFHRAFTQARLLTDATLTQPKRLATNAICLWGEHLTHIETVLCGLRTHGQGKELWKGDLITCHLLQSLALEKHVTIENRPE